MNYRWGLIWVLLILNFLTWTIVWRATPTGELVVTFLDVGQGDSILITAPNGNQLLIDGGPDRQVLRSLGSVMPFFDRTIDLVIASHPDMDHIGGLPAILETYEILGFMEPNFQAETAVYRKLQALIREEESVRFFAKAGTKIKLSPSVDLEILEAKPATWGPRGGKPDANYSSIVAKLTYASTSFLFMGDAPIKLEKEILAKFSNKLQADVLKVSHHGAKSSNSLAFLRVVKPQMSVISVGAKNRYNHPSPETLAWLEQVKTKILQTKDLGTIKLKSDGLSVGF